MVGILLGIGRVEADDELEECGEGKFFGPGEEGVEFCEGFAVGDEGLEGGECDRSVFEEGMGEGWKRGLGRCGWWSRHVSRIKLV